MSMERLRSVFSQMHRSGEHLRNKGRCGALMSQRHSTSASLCETFLSIWSWNQIYRNIALTILYPGYCCGHVVVISSVRHRPLSSQPLGPAAAMAAGATSAGASTDRRGVEHIKERLLTTVYSENPEGARSEGGRLRRPKECTGVLSILQYPPSPHGRFPPPRFKPASFGRPGVTIPHRNNPSSPIPMHPHAHPQVFLATSQSPATCELEWVEESA